MQYQFTPRRGAWAFLALTALLVAPGARAADVGVSIQVGQPGFYGRIDIGGAPPPRVVYPEPIWVQRRPVVVAPVYLRVPPGHQKNWAKHCYRYDACGVPVYFVHEDWYAEQYERRERREDERERERENGRGHGKGHKHDRDRD